MNQPFALGRTILARPFGSATLGSALVPRPLRPGGWTPLKGDVLAGVPNDRDHWAVLAQADALVAHDFRRAVEPAMQARPDIDIFYADDADLAETDPSRRLRLKPAFDLTLLAAEDYIGAPLIVRGAALHRLKGLRSEMGEAALYDLVLRAQAAGMAIERIPRVLIGWPNGRPAAAPAARRRALQAWIGPRPLEVVEGRTPDTLQLRRRFDRHPEVTLVVPTRQSGPKGRPYVLDLLDSLTATDWPMDSLTVLIGDDNPDAAPFAQGAWPFAVRRTPTPRAPGEPFSYAGKMNRLWRMADTEHLVLLNDDAAVLSPGWLKGLMTFAMDRDVGGVGARLLFPDGRVQHAGVVGGLFGTASHAWFGEPGDRPSYQDWALVHREWSMVTGAVFATRRSVLEAANGFDERFTVEFNDVDLCLRLRLLGYRIVCTPFAELTHREKASRGEAAPAGEQVALFLNRWRDWLADDPAYHPALTRDRPAPEPVEDAEELD
jgi:hypothetical protein